MGGGHQGGGHPKKLTEEDIRLIRELYEPPPKRMTMKDIALKFGVSEQLISRVVSGQSYRRVKP